MGPLNFPVPPHDTFFAVMLSCLGAVPNPPVALDGFLEGWVLWRLAVLDRFGIFKQPT